MKKVIAYTNLFAVGSPGESDGDGKHVELCFSFMFCLITDSVLLQEIYARKTFCKSRWRAMGWTAAKAK